MELGSNTTIKSWPRFILPICLPPETHASHLCSPGMPPPHPPHTIQRPLCWLNSAAAKLSSLGLHQRREASICVLAYLPLCRWHFHNDEDGSAQETCTEPLAFQYCILNVFNFKRYKKLLKFFSRQLLFTTFSPWNPF